MAYGKTDTPNWSLSHYALPSTGCNGSLAVLSTHIYIYIYMNVLETLTTPLRNIKRSTKQSQQACKKPFELKQYRFSLTKFSIKMPIYRIAIGTPGEASHPDALKAALAEFFSMLIFVFAGQGSGMAFSKILHSNNYLYFNI